MHFYIRRAVNDRLRGAPGAPDDVAAVIAEVCSDGFVCRELCLDANGGILRAAPTRGSSAVLLGNRALPAESLTRDLDSTEFERLWQKAIDDEAS